MENLAAMISLLEQLDGKLATAVASPEPALVKVIKEVLLTRHQIRQYAQRNSHLFQEGAAKGRVNNLRLGSAYNIDAINDRYKDVIACPRCDATDVAFIRQVSAQEHNLTYNSHHNRRLKLVFHEHTPTAGRFSCNTCLTRFDPPLPPHAVKICEMLFTYY